MFLLVIKMCELNLLLNQKIEKIFIMFFFFGQNMEVELFVFGKRKKIKDI